MVQSIAKLDAIDAAKLSPEMRGFFWFDIDASQMRHIAPGPDNGKLVFPELEGVYTPLWDLSIKSGPSLDELRAEEKKITAADKLARIAIMRERVENGLFALEETHDEPAPDDGMDELDEAPQDEWVNFFGGGMLPSERIAAEQDDETPHVYG